MKQTRRERFRENTKIEIREIAWQQIAEKGAAALSLRAIAEEMGLSAPALYRYYESRDALVTALIVEAFTSLGKVLEAARDAFPENEHGKRYAATGLAYRHWALNYPQRYLMVFGTPIPGYLAPLEITQPAAAHALGVLMDVIQAAWEAGILHFPGEFHQPAPQLTPQFDAWRAGLGLRLGDPILCLTLISWSRVHGLVSLEVDHQLPPYITEPGELFSIEITLLLNQFGISLTAEAVSEISDVCKKLVHE